MRQQTIFRNASPTGRFTVIDNRLLQAKGVSPEVRGFIAALLSRSLDWQYHAGWAKTEFGIGEAKLERIIRDAKKAGFMKVERERNPETGRMTGASVFLFTDVPGVFFSATGETTDTEDDQTVTGVSQETENHPPYKGHTGTKGRSAKSQGSPAASRGAAAISSGSTADADAVPEDESAPPVTTAASPRGSSDFAGAKPDRKRVSSGRSSRENRAPGALRDGDLEDGRKNPPAPPPAAGSREGVQGSWTEVRAVSAHPTPVADLARWLRQSDNDPEGLLSAKLVYPAHCAVLGRLIVRHGREHVISAVLDYTTGGRQPGCDVWWNGGEPRRRGHVVSWTYFEAALSGERKAA